MAIGPARHEHERYLLELLDTTAKTVERTIRRLDQDMTSDRETLHLILREFRESGMIWNLSLPLRP